MAVSDTTLALAVSTCNTRQEAAKQVGISERTLYRKLNDPDFNRRVLAFRQQIENQIVTDLSNAASAAVRVLHGLAVSAKDDGIKLKAANSILEHFQNLPNPSVDKNSNNNITEAELGRKLEIAYSAGRYGYVLPTTGTIPPEIKERLPSDPRAQAHIMQLVDEKLAEFRAGTGNQATGAETVPALTSASA